MPKWSEEEYRKALQQNPDLKSDDDGGAFSAQHVQPSAQKSPAIGKNAYKILWREHENAIHKQFQLAMRDIRWLYQLHVVQAGAPNQRIYRDGHAVAIETGKGPTDFVGVWKYGSVGIDAKVVSGTTLRFKRPTASSAGNWHQFEYMRALHRLDNRYERRVSLAGVFVRFIEYNVVKWADISEFTDNGVIGYNDCWDIGDVFTLLERTEEYVRQY